MNGAEFPQLTSETVGTLFSHISRRNSDMKNNNVITNSAEFGLIPQRDFFDKDIAVEGNTDKYYIIGRGDFVYNPRKSTTAPYGPFNCYQGEEEGIVSPLYTCLKPLYPEMADYLLWYFRSPAWYSYIYHNGAQGGARHDRVGMTNDLMDGIPVNLPCKTEQKKISEFFTLLDKRITAQQHLVEALKSYKRGVIFAAFREDNRFNFDMKYTPMASLLTVYRNRDTSGLRVCSVAVQKGVVDQIEHLGRSFAASDTSNYGRVEYGDVVYTKSPTGDFPYGIVKQSHLKENVAVSPLYGVYHPSSLEAGRLLHYYFEQKEYTNNYVRSLAQKGAKNTINITTERFLEKAILFPANDSSVKVLVGMLDAIEKQIATQTAVLERLQIYKKTLLQQLFI